MNRYEAYKDSGIEWVNEIPSSWSVVGIKRISKTNTGITFTKSDLVEEGLPVVSYGQIHAKTNTGTSLSQDLVRFIPESLTEGKDNTLVNRNGFIFADTSEDLEGCGNCVFVDKDESIYAGYHTIVMTLDRPEYGKYLAYLFKTDSWRSQIRSKVNGVKLFSITQTILNSCSVVLPPVEEQTAIAEYLDDKCSKIDSLIADKEKQLEDLKVYKSSLISETVTKGLDSTVQMKDSGIEWIGKIPSNWSSKKISLLFGSIGSGTTPTSGDPKYYSDGNNCWLQTGDLTDGIISSCAKLITDLAVSECNLKKYPKGSLVVAMYGATIAKLGILDFDTYVNQACCVLSNSINYDMTYAYYCLYASKQDLINKSFGGGQPNISQAVIKKHILPVPPLEEQKAIAEYLEDKCSKIDSLTTEIQAEIESLNEYKSSIISEAVTGKIKVC